MVVSKGKWHWTGLFNNFEMGPFQSGHMWFSLVWCPPEVLTGPAHSCCSIANFYHNPSFLVKRLNLLIFVFASDYEFDEVLTCVLLSSVLLILHWGNWQMIQLLQSPSPSSIPSIIILRLDCNALHPSVSKQNVQQTTKYNRLLTHTKQNWPYCSGPIG